MARAMPSPSLAEHLNFYTKQWWHRRLARGVLATPPIRPEADGVVLFSMIGSRVLLPYLLAVKSFQRRLGMGRVVILDDGSLNDADRAVLAYHLGGPEIIPIGRVDTGPCPRGGTWERLLTILDRRGRDYVIQLDSDTLTLGEVPEIRAALAAGRSFTIRGEASAALQPAAAYGATAAAGAHIQAATEGAMDRLLPSWLAAPRYIRGCSGFAGFAPGGDGRRLAEAFSQASEALLGHDRWREWGTEQVTSNVVIANEPDPLLLPYDRYLNFWGEALPPDPALVHFVGTKRFSGRCYLQATRAVIAALRG